MITCNPDSSPFSFYSASAGANSSLILASDSPTNLLKTSGPLIIYGSAQFNASAIFLAISVFPVPGGPCKSIPLVCLNPERDPYLSISD